VDENKVAQAVFAGTFPVRSQSRRNRLLHPSTAWCPWSFRSGSGFETRVHPLAPATCL